MMCYFDVEVSIQQAVLLICFSDNLTQEFIESCEENPFPHSQAYRSGFYMDYFFKMEIKEHFGVNLANFVIVFIQVSRCHSFFCHPIVTRPPSMLFYTDIPSHRSKHL